MRVDRLNRVVVGSLIAMLLLATYSSQHIAPNARADDATISKLSLEDQQALRLGRQVVAVRKAIKEYEAPASIKAVADVGTITANFVCLRGWLNEELRTATHMLSVRKGKPRDDLQKKVTFLKRAIRAIDLG